MYHLVDKENLKTIYLGNLAKNEIKQPNVLEIMNLRYEFDDSMNLERLNLVNYYAEAYILLTEGLAKFTPSYIVSPTGNEHEKVYTFQSLSGCIQ